MSHEDSRYLSPEHRQLLRTGARLPLTLTLLAHADYMDERVEQAEALMKELVEALAIAKVNAKHNYLHPGDPGHGCWTTCSACVIEAALARAGTAETKP